MKLTDLKHNAVPEGFKVVADISTAHLTKEDARLMESGTDSPGFIGQFEYGYFWVTAAHREQATLRKLGYSETFITLLGRLNIMRIYYVAFDQDADALDDVPTFDW